MVSVRSTGTTPANQRCKAANGPRAAGGVPVAGGAGNGVEEVEQEVFMAGIGCHKPSQLMAVHKSPRHTPPRTPERHSSVRPGHSFDCTRAFTHAPMPGSSRFFTAARWRRRLAGVGGAPEGPGGGVVFQADVRLVSAVGICQELLRG